MIHGDMIGRLGRARPNCEALVDVVGGRRYTYAQMSAQVNRMAHFLSELGIAKGDRVAVLAFNRADYIFLFFGLSRLGAMMVPLNTRQTPAELVYNLTDSAPKAFFFDQAHAEAAEELSRRVNLEHWVCFDQAAGPGLSLARAWDGWSQAEPAPVDIGPDDPQLMIYTSGTTGVPKGVVQTHGMLAWNCLNTVVGWDLRHTDRTVLHAAMFYTAGWNVFTLPVFMAAGANVLIAGFDASLVLKLIEEEGLSLFFGVPTMFQMMAENPAFAEVNFSRLRFAVSGGAALPAKVREHYLATKGLRIWEGYGLTEVGPNNFAANGKPGTIGTPMPFMDVRLVDDDGNDVPAGGEGEILLSGPNMCAGYWNKPEATAEAIKDGWFHTGDMGGVDADGHYSIVGRKKDMLISGGINIYPAEIEAQICRHPAVAAAAVIGVPDDKWGEVGKAVVELKEGCSLTLEELNGFLKETLGKFKLPKHLVAIDKLPRTAASEKIQKFLLKKEHGRADNL